MNEWPLIETAPRDGTRILGTDGEKVSGTYFLPYWGWQCEARFNDEEFETWNPTRWMPMPDPR